MIDELMGDDIGDDIGNMDDVPDYDDYDQNAGGSENELESDTNTDQEETLTQSGDNTNQEKSDQGMGQGEQQPSVGNETPLQEGGNTAIGINGEQFQRANLNNLQPLDNNTTPNNNMMKPIVGGGSINTQANFAPPPDALAKQDEPRPHLVSNMEVKMNGGGEFDMEEIDLSAYGGSKPNFEVKQRDDDKAIENLNAELLGIQTGGESEKIEKSINHGVQQTLNNAVPTQQPGIMFGGTPQIPSTQTQLSTPANNNSGLNFSFNQTNTNAGSMGDGVQMGGMMPRKTVSFNDQVKVVELDTKISEGFMYSGSKNLDPFQA
jgi:hypothetical protein